MMLEKSRGFQVQSEMGVGLRFRGPKGGNLSQSFAEGATSFDNKRELKRFLLKDDGGDTGSVALASGKFGEKKRS
jgi:hypothetical protein